MIRPQSGAELCLLAVDSSPHRHESVGERDLSIAVANLLLARTDATGAVLPRASSRARLFNDADRAQALPRTSAGDPEQARLREREDLQARVASLICNLGGIVALPLLLPLG